MSAAGTRQHIVVQTFRLGFLLPIPRPILSLWQPVRSVYLAWSISYDLPDIKSSKMKREFPEPTHEVPNEDPDDHKVPEKRCKVTNELVRKGREVQVQHTCIHLQNYEGEEILKGPDP